MLKTDIPKILVVNDDANTLMAFLGLLSNWEQELEYQVLSAQSGAEALRHVLNNDFAAILLDVNMPGMDGFETAEAIHQRQRSASTPIIFVTAFHADELNKFKGYEKGAVDYLFTPIVPEVLRAKLSVFVGLAKKNLLLKSQADALNRRTQELEAINNRLKEEMHERRLAEQENRNKDRFMAMLGHELRNPLSAITTAASLLNMPGLKPEKLANVKDVIQRQSLHLTHIVDDLLDLSRIMSGKVVLDKKPLELSRVVDSCLESMTLSGRTTQHKIDTDIEPVWIDGDPTRIEQIVTNLLDNAFKYTPVGGTVTLVSKVQDNLVCFSVQDNGVGIPEELLPKIFDVFTQGEQSIDRSMGGLGIGLALVRQLIELHGGSISAESGGNGQGSVFTLYIPRSNEIQDRHAELANTTFQKNHRVLLIEDNKDAREMMSILLSSFGHSVKQAADGAEGLKMVNEDRPDVVVIDIGLPVIDGHEVARRLRQDPQTSDIPLIALTGYGTSADRDQAIEAGFNAHLTKPVDTVDLVKAIESCISSSKASRPATPATRQLAT